MRYVRSGALFTVNSLSEITGFDEWHDETGGLRPHWVPLDEGLRRIGSVALARRWEEARRLIRDNGVTYSSLADPSGHKRPWELDPIPALLPHEDWSWLQKALSQRAALLQKILEDVYGPQELILGGHIPAELVYAHPGWQRPCVGLCYPPGARMLLYGADVVRDAEGRWLALRDRAQSPTGFGYVLENRLVVARMFPELFKECATQPLAPFFHSLRRTLSELTGEGESPRIVVLSGGPSTPGYFEDAYLSQYLGCLLVEGGDLTVRGDRVYLKMLDGLQSVEVVVRRVPDSACDPLELKPDSWAGVPGLLQAVRSGNVVVTNGIGSGWLESPALATFLPDLCRELLGEELLLPSLPSGWCAQPEGKAWVLQHFEELLIRLTFPNKMEPDQGPWLVRDLAPEKRAWLLAEIERRPLDFVGQKWCQLPTFPSLQEHQLARRPGHFRFFAAQVGSNPLVGGLGDTPYGFSVMPGGMVRTRKSVEERALSKGQSWIGSKDLWWLREDGQSLSEEDAALTGLRPIGRTLPFQTRGTLHLTRGGSDLPSRSADDFFWLGRYLERVEFLVRLARVCLNRGAERSDLSGLEAELLTRWPSFDHKLDFQKSVERWVVESEKSDGLGTLLMSVQQLSGALRDRLSADSLAVVNSLKRTQVIFREPNQVLNYLEQLTMPLWAWSGIVNESLHRGHGFRFLELGRRLERATQTCRLLLTLVAPGKLPKDSKRKALQEPKGPRDASSESFLMEAVLEIGESARIYRRRYQTFLHKSAVLDLLLADEGNPRSILYQLTLLAQHMSGLPREHRLARQSSAELILVKSVAAIRLFPIDNHAMPGNSPEFPASEYNARLEELLGGLEDDLGTFSNSLSQKYLTHLHPRQQREALVDHPWSEEG